MHFEIEIHANGTLADKFTTGAAKAAICGVWHGDWPYLPRFDHMVKGLPYRYLRAFERNPIWWTRKDDGCDVARCDLYRARDNAPMGSIFARLKA